MIKSRYVLGWLGILMCSLVGASGAFAQALKVACIGNSVTYGLGLKDPATESYPAVLQGLLGNKYEVRNFGFSGATLLKKGHKPYHKTKEFSDAVAYQPDIAIVHLGLNDTDPRNWPEYKGEFEADYAWLLDTLKKQNPKVKIYVCRLTPIFSGHPRFKSGTRDWFWQIQDRIPEIAKANGATLIDLHTALYNRPDLFADNLHPDQEGAAIIANTVYKKLSGNNGGLQLPPFFTDHMVLQRNQEIPIYGTANAGDQVEINLNNKKLTVVANSSGKWKVRFPAMGHGGPYQLSVKSKGKKIELNDILIGDIWLCSGQSNMAFPLIAAATGKGELQSLKKINNLRLLKLNQLAETNNQAWDSLTLAQVNRLQFFSGEWAVTDSGSAANFSAVAYYFGKKLVAEENVPIGLIQLAVGGSILESWIDRYTMEHDPWLVDELNNWRKSDFIQPWARERAAINLAHSKTVKQRHPYEPVYNYEAGIAKLTASPIKGVIWYQGESNAQQVELYEHAMPLLVSSWRKNWGINFPFYYVQLSSIDRPTWPSFRDAQRKLLKVIPHSGMAVSSDLGDSLDVHPIRKKEVGNRLALLALKQTYHRPVTATGPEAVSAIAHGNEVIISFAGAKSLVTANQQPLVGFELVTMKGKHLSAKGVIKNNKVHLVIPGVEQIKAVAYAWRPFTRANLQNEARLPASTFYLSLK
ncbi:sialate O-acetylesterase [Pedobacter sp. CAN_A7]|uniref:GDSL-type esterase/lipase family protein n=1 Tax=Pedobacter sp. CAN_A7 TaxID=2787722 RepID=UPI001A30F4E6